MKKIIITLCITGSFFMTGCNTSLVHKSQDEAWYQAQVEKEKKDPSKTVHNCPYCRCLLRDSNPSGLNAQK